MVNQDAKTQLTRIEEVQERLRQVLVDGTLQDVEELCAELSSRLASVLGEHSASPAGLAHHSEQVQRIGVAQDELAQLGLRVRNSLSDQLGRARRACHVANSYTIEPTRTTAELRTTTDIIS